MAGSWQETETGAKLWKGHNVNRSFLFHAVGRTKGACSTDSFVVKIALQGWQGMQSFARPFLPKSLSVVLWEKHQLFFFSTLSQSHASALPSALPNETECTLVLPHHYLEWTQWQKHTLPINTTSIMPVSFWFPWFVVFLHQITLFCICNPTHKIVSHNNLWFWTSHDEDRFVGD